MDINDIKALIKSLVLTSASPYSVTKLVQDFEAEAGIRFPLFNFSNPKAFLKSLTDTVKFVGSSPHEKILPVVSEKTQHISSLIKRQGRMRFNQRAKLSHPDKFLPENPFEQEYSTVSDKSCKNLKSEVSDGNKDKSMKIKSQNDYLHDSAYEDFIFKEDEISSIEKCPGLDPGLRLISTSKKKNCDLISEAGSSSSSGISSKSCYVNEGVKNKLKKLISMQTRGIWCCDLPSLYEDYYKFSLEFKEYGYRSLIAMVMELNDIFRCVRPGNGDWLLFDASKPPSEEEMDIRSVSQCRIPEYVEKNLSQLIESHCENGARPGVYLDDLLVLYFKKFRKRLNFTEFGFPNIKSLLIKLDGNILHLEKEGYRFIIKPIVEQKVVNLEMAVLPITPDDDFFTELFPDDVVKQGENFPKLKIENHFRIGKKIDVNVADVWSPDKFYVQLKEYEEDFFNLNRNLQAFYNGNVNKYKMPDATVQPNQVCVAYFNDGEGFDEWNRSVIVRKTKSNEALVYFVDYGNKARIDIKNLRFLHRDFFKLPSQSFAARLSFVEPPSDKIWPSETCERFLKLVTVPTAELHVISIDLEREKIGGVIISVNGDTRINVAVALVKEKMAVCNDISQLEDFAPLRTKSVIKKTPTLDRNENELQHKAPVNTKKIDRNRKSIKENDVESQGKDEMFKLNDIADGKINPEETQKIETISEVQPVRKIPSGQSIYITNVNVAHDIPALQLERDIYALAFWVMSTNELVKKVAQTDLNSGLQMALNLARNMSNLKGVAFVDLK